MIAIYNTYKEAIFIFSVILPIFIAVFHHFVLGAKDVRLNYSSHTIQRFSIPERIFHFIRMITFIIVATTGVSFVFHEGDESAGEIHGINGIVFLVISICTLFIWFKPSLFKAYDRIWLRHLGGYLSKRNASLPAGKFNAGQKIFFWISIILSLILAVTGISLIHNHGEGMTLVIHGMTAALFIIAVIGHVYLSLWATKGTWQVLTSGKVTKEWAQHHHPNWKN